MVKKERAGEGMGVSFGLVEYDMVIVSALWMG